MVFSFSSAMFPHIILDLREMSAMKLKWDLMTHFLQMIGIDLKPLQGSLSLSLYRDSYTQEVSNPIQIALTRRERQKW